MSDKKLFQPQSALDIGADVNAKRSTATRSVQGALDRIASGNRAINAFTAVLPERAMAQAANLDAEVAAGKRAASLAGVPFAVKNLFDVEGLATLAGSRIYASAPAAKRDAMLVRQLTNAGAVLVGALNMDEFAYGFSTQNTHFGATRNPHALDRIAGGSSGGAAAAVAAGLVPVALGSDTNGSIRVPAALCGVYGLKPTYGRLGRSGSFLFAASLDHVGPFARSLDDLAAVYDVLQGIDPDDPACAGRPVEPVVAILNQGVSDLRIGIASGFFERGGVSEVFAALALVADALGVTRRVEIPRAATARAAAMIMTAAEGAELHLAELQTRLAEFDPMTRHLFLSGAMVPASWYLRAQRFRRDYCGEAPRVTMVVASLDICL